jgi:hypothetical protein
MGIGIGWVMCIVYVEYKSVSMLRRLPDCKGLVASRPYFEEQSILTCLERDTTITTAAYPKIMNYVQEGSV